MANIAGLRLAGILFAALFVLIGITLQLISVRYSYQTSQTSERSGVLSPGPLIHTALGLQLTLELCLG
jgi:hypothetical protein